MTLKGKMLSLGKGDIPVGPSEGEKELQELKGSFSSPHEMGMQGV